MRLFWGQAAAMQICTTAQRAAGVLAITLLTATTAWATITGSGTQSDPYVINTAADWNYYFANADYATTYWASGKYVKLGADIVVNKMLPTSSTTTYQGIFDGDGHKITVTFGTTTAFLTEDNATPFQYIDGATFKNLQVSGYIYTAKKFAAGIASHSSGTCTIQNCISSIWIYSSITTTGANASSDLDGTHAGFVAVMESGKLNITDCVFNGKLLSNQRNNKCAGFVGWKGNNTLNITRGLFDPAQVTIENDGSATFARNCLSTNKSSYTFTDCYYTKSFGEGAGIQGTNASLYVVEGLLAELGNYWQLKNSKVVPKTTDEIITLSGKGTSGNPYKISNNADWSKFAEYIANNLANDAHYQLTGNITSVTAPVGSDSQRFSGTLNGGNHSVTLSINSSNQNAALFHTVEGATFTNLTVDGSIQSSAKYAAGFVGQVYGNTSFENCISSVVITGSLSDDGTYGGFAAQQSSGSTSFENCVFNGKLLTTTSTNKCAGFLGWRNGTLSMSNCIYAPAAIADNETEVLDGTNDHPSSTFARPQSTTEIPATCYYTRKLGEEQGTQVLASIPANGLCTGLTIMGVTVYQQAGETAISGVNESYFLSETPIAITPTVTYNDNTLTAANYTVSYTKNDAPVQDINETGTYTLTVSGVAAKGYYGSKSITFLVEEQTYTKETIGSYEFTKDAEGNYLIQTADDWNNLAEVVAAGIDCDKKHFVMTADIGTPEAPITKALGRQVGGNKSKDRMRFAGTFDGAGHTLTIGLVAIQKQVGNWFYFNSANCAPFSYVKNTVIKNLHVAGTIVSHGQFASGLVGSTGSGSSDGNITIENCQVSVSITANYVTNNNNYGNHGGFIGVSEGIATIKNSWFDGEFLGKEYKYSAGFIGINKGKGTTFTNCLFHPTKIDFADSKVEGSCEYVHDMQNGKSTLINAYWVIPFGTPENAQGQQVFTSYSAGDIPVEVEAADGNTYYKIAGKSAWHALKETLAGDDASFTLDQDYVGGNTDEALVIPANKDFTLNMNGHTINRGLTLEEAQTDGYVIKVENGATLTINGGTLTGGRNNGNGGGIYNAGTLIINGTTIRDNYVTGNGGGIYNAGTLNMADVTITGNIGNDKRCKGMGVYAEGSSTVSMQGNVQIKNNNYLIYNPILQQGPRNLYLDGTAAMTIADALDAASSIGIAEKNNTGVFTSGLNGNGGRKNFVSDEADIYVYLNKDGEVFLASSVDLDLANEADNQTVIDNTNGACANVTLSGRTLWKDGDWNTLCLPFDVDLTADGCPLSGADVRQLNSSSFEDGDLSLGFTDEYSVKTIKAGTPYIIKWTKGDGYDEAKEDERDLHDPVFKGVMINADMHDVASNEGLVLFKGNYAPRVFETENRSILMLGTNSTLYFPQPSIDTKTKTKKNPGIKSFRAYFELTDPQFKVKAFRMNFEEDDVTGILTMADGKNKMADVWYDLSGRKLNGKPTHAGIYINNGKKVVMK